MTKRFSLILFTIILCLLAVGVPVARADAGDDLSVQFGNPPSSPLFEVIGMMPGDEEVKEISVMNNGAVPRLVGVKAVRIGPDEEEEGDPLLETILEVVIDDAPGGASQVYYGEGSAGGVKTVEEWFADSTGDGVPLTVLTPGEDATYRVKVKFPWEAENEFQGKKMVFALKIGVIAGMQNLKINEVYYRVEEGRGLDSPLDRGIVSVNGDQVTVIISDTGAGSTNIAVVKMSEVCKVIQKNNGTVINNINLNQNTGGNSGGGTISTSGIFNFINISNWFNINFAGLSCGKRLGQNDEWVELYNPSGKDISLKNWRLRDNSGQETIIKANKKVKAGGFALLSKDSSTWKHWNEPWLTTKIQLGQQIGDGLDNEGDHLYLINPDEEVVDGTAWGDDTEIWNPAVPLVGLDASMERLFPGFDTDMPSDWEERDPPTPGE
jgi:hypothetical protein